MKCSYVPGNVGGDVGEEFREAAQFVCGVVEAGDEQRHDLEPHAHAVNAPDAVENRTDATTKFVIVAIVEALEIDFVQVNPGMQIFEYLWGGVAVGNERGQQSGGLGLFEDGDGPFAGDQRLVVSTDKDFGPLIESLAHQRLRRR